MLVAGIEPASTRPQRDVLPLYYTSRDSSTITNSRLPRASAKASGYSTVSRPTVAPAQQLISINSVQNSTALSSGSTTLCPSATALPNVTSSNLTSVTSRPTPIVSQSKRPLEPSPTSSLGEMPQKRILTKKGVVSSPTVVNPNVNAPPEVVTASRVTRIPIPKGTKVPLVVAKPPKQQKTVTTTAAVTTTTDTLTQCTIAVDPPTTDSTIVSSATSSLADWAIDFQIQLRTMNSRFAAYENRLNEVEHLTAENSQLKFALADANQLIATLQAEVKRLSAPPHNVPMSYVSVAASDPVSSGDFGNTSAVSGVSDGSIFAGNSSVSKYASQKAAVVDQNPPATGSPPKPTTRFTVVKRKRKSKKPVPPTPAALAAFSRKFSSNSDPSSANGYRFVYYKASKHPLSWYRSKLLPMVGINDSRVLDIHFPTQRVVSFLLHSDFVLEFTSILHQKLNHDPLLDFDPLEDRNLLDPAFASLDTVSRAQKLRDLQNIRVLRALTFVRRSVRVSVAKSMLLQDFITQSQFDAILADTLEARTARTPVPNASAAERKEKNRIRVDFLFNLNFMDPLSAMTLATTPSPDLPAVPRSAHANDASTDMQD